MKKVKQEDIVENISQKNSVGETESEYRCRIRGRRRGVSLTENSELLY